mgnify:FL=1|jgi:predicted transcriptional regulator
MTPSKREFVLVNFLEFEGPLSIRALAEKTGCDQTTIGNDLNRLLEGGVVARDEVEGWSHGTLRAAKRSRYVWRLA